MLKEKLSALMDGETVDNEVLAALREDKNLQQSWESYHLIRDTLRNDIGEVVHIDIAAKVAEAINHEPATVSTLLPEAQPHPEQWSKAPFWQKIRPWAAQITQIGVAACVSLVVIFGVQQYNAQPDKQLSESEAPVFNTLPMMGQASPVSLGVASPASESNRTNRQPDEQINRVNAMLQDYELQRRLHAEQMQSERETELQTSDNPISGIKQK